eukprot:3324925-Rhodomonas_salina.1
MEIVTSCLTGLARTNLAIAALAKRAFGVRSVLYGLRAPPQSQQFRAQLTTLADTRNVRTYVWPRRAIGEGRDVSIFSRATTSVRYSTLLFSSPRSIQTTGSCPWRAGLCAAMGAVWLVPVDRPQRLTWLPRTRHTIDHGTRTEHTVRLSTTVV